MLCRNAGETIENQDSSVFDFDIILGLMQSSPSIQELAGITSSQAEILLIRRTWWSIWWISDGDDDDDGGGDDDDDDSADADDDDDHPKEASSGPKLPLSGRDGSQKWPLMKWP